MIRSLLRAVKRFLWKHAGILQLTENHAATHRELGNLRAQLQRHSQVLCELTASAAYIHLLSRVPDDVATLRVAVEQLRAETERHFQEVRDADEERGRQAGEQLRAALAEQSALLTRQLHESSAEQTAALQQFLADVFPRLSQELTASRTDAQRNHEILAGHLARLAEVQQALAGELSQLKAAGASQQRLEQCHAELTEHLNGLRDQLAQAGAAQQDRLGALLAEIQGWGIDRWRIQEYGGLIRYFRKKHHQQDVATGRVMAPRLETAHPVAALSNDTLFPRGAKNDNSISLRFNRKLYALLGHKLRLKILDFGCAGGGFVRSLLDDGHLAVGLEGSPYPRDNQLGEWATIPQHLHTCDITQPFTLRDPATDQPVQFDAITAWEVMEHIPEEALPGFFANLRKHLAPDGYFLCSIATFLDHDAAAGVVWHVTVKPKEWWAARFWEAGFDVCVQDALGKDDWLRGSGHCRGDWHEDQGLGFHLVVRRRAAAALAAA